MNSLSAFYKSEKRIGILYSISVCFVLLTIAAGLFLGNTHLQITQIFKEGTPDWRIFWYIRFPRTIACLMTGGALSVSGAIIQGVLANRLASPSIIGVNSGAGLMITIMTALGIYSGWPMTIGAFAGGFGAILLISIGAARFGASRGTVILAGVALNSFLNAISQAIVTFKPETGVMSNDFKVGDLSGVSYMELVPAVILISVTLVIVWMRSNDLEVLTLGEENAQGLGMQVPKVRIWFLIAASVLAASAVTMAGLLSFVGLLVPHSMRRLGVWQMRHLIPLCAICGGGFVGVCDLASRMLFAPFEIPVGILLAFIGAPFFMFLLLKGKDGRANA